jgi:tRNA threonylcarbamoyl adenosine modification protein YeaZ
MPTPDPATRPLLVVSTSSPALSLALVADGGVLAAEHLLIGRGHAEALVPAVAALLAGQRPASILVDIGPGSYTGIRIGVAAARALGLAWGVPVHGLSALALVAAPWLAAHPAAPSVLALIDAGRGQAAGAVVERDLLVPSARLVQALPIDTPATGAGAALLAGKGRADPDAGHPNAAAAALVPAAAWTGLEPLYVGD